MIIDLDQTIKIRKILTCAFNVLKL